jgi:DNA-binding NarL/FixJ family response regulator
MEKDARQSRLRVLLADEDCVRTPLLHLLSGSSQLDVVADTSPQQTSALLDRHPPDVVLAGTYPPQRAWLLLAELASMRVFDRPLAIAHVAQHSQASWNRWQALGFDGYLLKDLGSGLAERLLAVVADLRAAGSSSCRVTAREA